MLNYRGIPYITFGNSSLFTSSNTQIEKIFRIMGFPIIIKSYIFNRNQKYAKSFLKKLDDIKDFILYVNHYPTDNLQKYYKYPLKLYSYSKPLQSGSFLTVYTDDNLYIGSPDFAWNLRNLVNFESTSSVDRISKVANIGFDPVDNIWYGWSHRAKVGFTIGDRIFQETYGNNRTPFKLKGTKVISNLADARQAAINFAEYIS